MTDIWASSRDSPGVAHVQHFDGSAWTKLALPQIDSIPNYDGIATAGPGQAWVLALPNNKPPVLLRVGVAGVVEDRSSDLAAVSPSGFGVPRLVARNGWVFAMGTGGSGQTFLYRLADGKFTAVAGVPADLSSEPFFPVGPDELYAGGAVTVFHHYKAGSWPAVPFSSTGAILVSATSPADVWFWFLKANAGGSGFRGDGSTWSPFSVTGWPSTGFQKIGAGPLYMVSTSQGNVTLVVNEAQGGGSSATDEVTALHLDANQKISGQETLFVPNDCNDAIGACYSDAASFGGELGDGTLLFTTTLLRNDATMRAWYAVKIHG